MAPLVRVHHGYWIGGSLK
ncbi:uncharacterized protein CPUR_04382 [Claviceps purpurea 20.1]|uniref:Uncharacterized protein n=1 Tax=Claviceps purpurea (strain 20.1) TaxID=1111077 RepID=M1WF24_CLAP2|nr:uncharacterized protein CPUR_04382 [Claviceps purpurea 20.1]